MLGFNSHLATWVGGHTVVGSFILREGLRDTKAIAITISSHSKVFAGLDRLFAFHPLNLGLCWKYKNHLHLGECKLMLCYT